MSYSHGDYKVVCARCGRQKLRSQVMKDRSGGNVNAKDNLLVCREHFDGIHPQTKQTPRVHDPRTLDGKYLRPDSEPTYRCNYGNWEDINTNWEDINCVWEDMDGSGTNTIIKSEY